MEKNIETMREQIKKGYLKLAILYTLLREPLHGYEIIKRIKMGTFNILTPTAGSLYPALKELEADGLVRGEWRQHKRKIKVYSITDKGKEAFKQIIEKHFTLASAIRKWLLKYLTLVHSIEDVETTPVLMQAVKAILLDENVPIKDRIEVLRDLKGKLCELSNFLNKFIIGIDERIKILEKEVENLK